MSQIVKHETGVEFAFPAKLDAIDNCPPWIRRLSGLDTDQVSAHLRKWWENADSGASSVLANWLAALVPHSVGQFETCFAIVLNRNIEPWLLFLTSMETESEVPEGVDEHVFSFLRPFLGVYEGLPYFPMNGFLSAKELIVVDFDAPSPKWGDYDETWDGAVAFYFTGCRNPIVVNKNGVFGKWLYAEQAFEPAFNKIIRTNSSVL